MSEIELFWYHIVISVYFCINGIFLILMIIALVNMLKYYRSELKRMLKELRKIHDEEKES